MKLMDSLVIPSVNEGMEKWELSVSAGESGNWLENNVH
jgi:hypothetical protein